MKGRRVAEQDARRGAIKSKMLQTSPPIERALLVGIEFKDAAFQGDVLWPVEDSLLELEQLALTAGVEVVGQTYQRISRPNPATLIGKGKVEELMWLQAEVSASLVIFDEELSPRQQRELERVLGDEVRIVDRTALILDVFAQHARTREGALQVELAQYEYRLPRLTRAWTHLARQAGGAAGRGGTGGVGLRGPGERQLEVDRREIRRRIGHLKSQLEEVRSQRRLYRARREDAGIPVIAIVGYTNAGKSTLLRALTGADVLVANQLFATLDPTTRRIPLTGGREALLTDTVGFIQRLPTDLVAAFRATLEEVLDADLLLHVVDITHPHALKQAITVGQVLEELGAADKPVVTALNKVDLLEDHAIIEALAQRFVREAPLAGDAVIISAANGVGLEHLLEQTDAALSRRMIPVKVFLPYQRGDLVAAIRRRGIVDEEWHEAEGTRIVGRVPESILGILDPYREQPTPT